MVKKEQIQNLARKHLSEFLEQPGSILYSSHETLKPGSVYLLGFNPGGSNGAPLGQSVASMLSYTGNAYIDERWKNGNGEWAEGDAPLQARIRWLLKELGLHTSEVCASNLIFLQSRQATDVSFSLAKKCWPVHEAILELVQPKLIIAYGNSNVSPYGYLRAMFEGEEEQIPSGHGNWKVKGFNCSIGGRPTYVAGVPHLSRYSPIDKHEVARWLAERL